MVIRTRGILGLVILLIVAVWLSLAVSSVEVRTRRPDPAGLEIPPGYRVTVVLSGLDSPADIAFDDQDTMYVAENERAVGDVGRVRRVTASGEDQTLVSGLSSPVTGVTRHQGRLYLAHRGKVSVWENGVLRDVVDELPSLGDYGNGKIVFGPDGKMYFGQGTATNSGVVGLDNAWLKENPKVRDLPAAPVNLKGANFATDNPLPPEKGQSKSATARTGAFLPFGTPCTPGMRVAGAAKPNGAIMRCEEDGSRLETVAWGLRNPAAVGFSSDGRLWTVNGGMSERGSRPITGAPDEFHEVKIGTWYGWPDFVAGEPVTKEEFKPITGPSVSALLAVHPSSNPPRPFTRFPSQAGPGGFDFSPGGRFGFAGDAFVALGGLKGARVVRVDLKTGQVHDFARNRNRGLEEGRTSEGFANPRAARFGPDGSLFVVDGGLRWRGDNESDLVPGTGVVWRISATNADSVPDEFFPRVPALGLDKVALGLVIGFGLGLLVSRQPFGKRRRR